MFCCCFGSLTISLGEIYACNAGDPGSVPRLGRSHGKGMATHSSFFLSAEFHGQRSLVGYSLWGRREIQLTNTHTHTHHKRIKK